MATLNLDSNYAEQMLSLYLWGQTKPPAPNKIADSQFIRSNAATTTADIDGKSYMDHVGNHLALGQQKMLQIFFNDAL